MIFSCSVCECQANTQSKLVVLEVGNHWMTAMLTPLWMMQCTGRREWELVNKALHWEEGTEPLLIFILSRQRNNQKSRDKGFNSEKSGSTFYLAVPMPKEEILDIHPGGPRIYQDLSPSVPGTVQIAIAYIKPVHTPKHLQSVFKMLSLSSNRRRGKHRSISWVCYLE